MKKISLPKIGIRPMPAELPSSVSFPIPVSRVWLKPLLAKKNSAVRM